MHLRLLFIFYRSSTVGEADMYFMPAEFIIYSNNSTNNGFFFSQIFLLVA